MQSNPEKRETASVLMGVSITLSLTSPETDSRKCHVLSDIAYENSCFSRGAFDRAMLGGAAHEVVGHVGEIGGEGAEPNEEGSKPAYGWGYDRARVRSGRAKRGG